MTNVLRVDDDRWSFNYFFFNKKTKKILFFACWCQGCAHQHLTLGQA